MEKKKQNLYKEMTLEDKKKVSAESGIVVGILLLLCYFFGFSYIWNTGYGSEASVNGWNYVMACLSRNYKGTEFIYGEFLAVPFYYYARYYVMVLGVMTTASLGILLIYIALSCFNIKTFHKELEMISTVTLYVLAASYLGCIIVGLMMNGSRILPEYCSGNPQCSVATLAFFQFFISLIAAISHTVFIHRNKEAL